MERLTCTDDVLRRLAGYIVKKNLIPIIGAGFTKGALAGSGGCVPAGSELKKQMIDQISEHESRLSKEYLTEKVKEFSKIADYYYRFVPREKFNKLLRSSFINVELPDAKRRFLCLKWPYLYTMNIDDAIEKNSKYDKVLPYKTLSEDIKAYGCVFKLHGDAFHELTYPEEKSIIFSRDQYVKSLEENRAILSLFQTDYADKNTIFIGCSLDDELDLHYAITTNKNEPSESSERIYVTSEDISFERELELEKFKLTLILKVDSYDNFYSTLSKLVESIESQGGLDHLKPVEISNIASRSRLNLEYLCGKQFIRKENQFLLPAYIIKRGIHSAVLSDINSKLITVIKGKYLSGKTTFLLRIAKDVNNRTPFFFASYSSWNEDNLKEWLLEYSDSLFIFDSNSIQFEMLNFIKDNLAKIYEKGSRILLCTSSSDRFLNSIINRIDDKWIVVRELDDRMHGQELIELNAQLSRLGYANFDKRLNIIENTYRMSSIYKLFERERFSYDRKIIDSEELGLLLLLATLDKVYSSAFNVVFSDYRSLNDLLKRNKPIIQEVSSRPFESHEHSGFKIVSNCKTCIIEKIRTFTLYERDSFNKVISVMHKIVARTKGHPIQKKIYQQLILFDNLNNIFYYEFKHRLRLILSIYESFEDILFDESHYWLQRAKGILHLKSNAVESVDEGIRYGLKAYHDSHSSSNLHYNSTFILALLCGRKVTLLDCKDDEANKDAIRWYYNAFSDTDHNMKYIEEYLRRQKAFRKEHDFFNLINYLRKFERFPYPELKKQAEYLVNFSILHLSKFSQYKKR